MTELQMNLSWTQSVLVGLSGHEFQPLSSVHIKGLEMPFYSDQTSSKLLAGLASMCSAISDASCTSCVPVLPVPISLGEPEDRELFANILGRYFRCLIHKMFIS